jgi:hypothetical protein
MEQITLNDALALIDSNSWPHFYIHCRMLTWDCLYKWNHYFSRAKEDNPKITVSEFIEKTNNYGSFFLTVRNNIEMEMYQLIDDNGEPL